MTAAEAWAARLRTLRAMILLCAARLLIAAVPFRIWRSWLGRAAPGEAGGLAGARRLAGQVGRAGMRLPFETKCLPRAMALSWLLRWSGQAHRVVLAVRPPGHRGGEDDLHAWVEIGDSIVLGELPGPWLRLHDAGN